MIPQLQPFLPTLDWHRSRMFYEQLGAICIYQDESLFLMKLGDVSFFLQRAYVKDWAENMVLQLYHADVDAFHSHLTLLMNDYPMIKVGHPKQQSYGYTFSFLDPAGVLWHITRPKT